MHGEQAVLFWAQMVLFYWYTMTLFWSPATSTGAKLHLRILMAIKSLSFTFSALQLRNGYPPPASYRSARQLCTPPPLTSVLPCIATPDNSSPSMLL